VIPLLQDMSARHRVEYSRINIVRISEVTSPPPSPSPSPPPSTANPTPTRAPCGHATTVSSCFLLLSPCLYISQPPCRLPLSLLAVVRTRRCVPMITPLMAVAASHVFGLRFDRFVLISMQHCTQQRTHTRDSDGGLLHPSPPRQQWQRRCMH
jgi:hypothetical protein